MARDQRDVTARPRMLGVTTLGRLGLAVILLVALAVGTTSRALGATTPNTGATYQVGTWIKGVCDMTGYDAGFTYTTLIPQNSDGTWSPPNVGDSSQPPTYRIFEGCTELLDSPGEYRVYLVHYDTRGAAEGGCGCLDQVTLQAQFTVVRHLSPCSGHDTEIVSVSTPNGGTSGLEDLKGTHFSPGETYTAKADVELELGDASLVRVTKGSRFSFNSCSLWPKEKDDWKITLSLFLGRIWSKISSRGEMDVRSPGATLGIRGAIFRVTYSKATKTTTFHVTEGAGWIRRLSGGPTVRLKGGQTAVQVGGSPPRLTRR